MPLDKKNTELEVARKFLDLYNRQFNTHFKVLSSSDHPDVECVDECTEAHLSLEIRLVEDLPGWMEHVLAGKPRRVSLHTATTAAEWTHDVVPLLRHALKDKLLSNYGPHTALVMKDVTPLLSPSDWEFFKVHYTSDLLSGKEHNYGAGIWVICTDQSPWPNTNVLFCLCEPGSSGR